MNNPRFVLIVLGEDKVMMVLSFTTSFAKAKIMNYLKENGPIPWKNIVEVVSKIVPFPAMADPRQNHEKITQAYTSQSAGQSSAWRAKESGKG